MTNTNSSKPGKAVGSAAQSRVGQAAPFKNVLVGVDGTASGRSAIALAETLCRAEGQLTLVHVTPSQVPLYHNFPAPRAVERCRALLEREREAVGATARLTAVCAQSVARGLHQLAEDYDADLVVVGSCRRGHVGRVLLGDDARSTASGASCAVAVAPHGYGEAPQATNTIGVAYDDSIESRAALAVARGLAASDGCPVSVITVVSPVAITVGGWGGLAPAWNNLTDTLVDTASELLRSVEGLDERRVVVGDVGSELVAFGDEVKLLVVGSRGYGPVRRVMLGSTSLQLTHDARCPLLVIPRPQRAGPPL